MKWLVLIVLAAQTSFAQITPVQEVSPEDVHVYTFDLNGNNNGISISVKGETHFLTLNGLDIPGSYLTGLTKEGCDELKMAFNIQLGQALSQNKKVRIDLNKWNSLIDENYQRSHGIYTAKDIVKTLVQVID